MIAVIDYDVGNLAAVTNMLQRVGVESIITNDAARIADAERIILPGNGAFDACMRNLRGTGLIPLLEKRVLEDNIPLLGICVGAQMLADGSEEGSEPGLGWIKMRVRRFENRPGLPVPHMGWNQVAVRQPDHYLVRDLMAGPRFYFVHSYYLDPVDASSVLLTAQYGIDFAAGVVRDNITGVQFHPEKSHRFGKKLLSAFAGT